MAHIRPLAFVMLCCCASLDAQTAHSADPQTDHTAAVSVPISGQWRLQWDGRHANPQGPLALANQVQPGTVAMPSGGITADLELQARGDGWHATATLQDQWQSGRGSVQHAWINELVASHAAGDWQLSAGKKIVSWDVGYAFRPNDVVQQETRRSLVNSTLEGRALLMAEQFAPDRAWSLVWVNPGHSQSDRAAQENALALRYYQRQGAADWYAFARSGLQSGASAGLATAWVATDALELHASWRGIHHAQTLNSDVRPDSLTTASPWQLTAGGTAHQLLIGGTWTDDSQLSLLAEVWWDGTAMPQSSWERWAQRNRSLSALSGAALPAAALAGNLAWQADALASAASLQRRNIYLRLSWEHEGWQPTLDVLYHPADGGRLWTLGLLHQGDRWRLQAGVRLAAGPAAAVLRQLPSSRQAFVSLVRSF